MNPSKDQNVLHPSKLSARSHPRPKEKPFRARKWPVIGAATALLGGSVCLSTPAHAGVLDVITDGAGVILDVLKNPQGYINNPLALAAYQAYFSSIGTGAEMRPLPPSVIEKLKPYFDDGMLAKVRYGASHHTFDDNAMTDCHKIYFSAGSGTVAAIKNEQIFADENKSKLHLLLHELTHSEQCDDVLGRGNYASMWFVELGVTTLTQLVPNPFGISAKKIHDKMPMEREADANADAILGSIRGFQWKYSMGGKLYWRYLATSGYLLQNLRFGDFDGDGRTDVFTASGRQWMYSSGGNGPWVNLGTSGYPLSQLRFGDFDCDGRTDVFTASGSQWIYSSGGIGEWVTMATSGVPLNELRFGDFDNDRCTDVFATWGGQWHYSSKGQGSWVNLASSKQSISNLAFGDFDGDGCTDVFTSDGGQWKYSSCGRSNWINLAISNTPMHRLRFGDFDGDKLTDVFTVSGSQWKYSRGGRYSWEVLRDLGYTSPDVRFGDFNNDGKTDVFAAEPR